MEHRRLFRFIRPVNNQPSPPQLITQSHAAVVVLGDIGRSPRMCNHAVMLTRLDYHVHIVGYADSTPHDMIANNPNISIVDLPPPPDFVVRLPEVVQLPIKLLWTMLTLNFALMFCTSHFDLRLILMQNPPGVPTMFVCYAMSLVKNAHFVIDWHNYMYSILMNKFKLTEADVFGAPDPEHRVSRVKRFIVRVIAELEGVCGKLSHANLCVSQAMQIDLARRWNVNADVFYDRPPSWKFQTASIEQIHNLYMDLSDTYDVLKGPEDVEDSTVITSIDKDGAVEKRQDRPLVLISSTSWTPDEDFGILLDALIKYNDNAEERKSQKDALPRVLVIITGRGPLKEHYLSKIAEMKMNFVDVVTPWLQAADYPVILQSADIGISLHTSTSGLDLPMKVVDMFGSGVPVLAKNFPCLSELVQEGRNGLMFDTSDELADQIVYLAAGFPRDSARIDELKNYFVENPFESWEMFWVPAANAAGFMIEAGQRMVRRSFCFAQSALGLLIVFGFFVAVVAVISHLYLPTRGIKVKHYF